MNLWERLVVPNLVSCACSSPAIMKQRAQLIPQASGVVLEIGCGSGTNFSLYDPDRVSHLYALEPSPGMLSKARRRAGELGVGASIELIEAGAGACGLPDQSVDTVELTFVLCTIPDWQSALAEVRRVLRPDGRVLFAEHGLAPDEGVARWQRRIEPVWRPLAGGCHLTRDTLSMLRSAGFEPQQAETGYLPRTPRIAGFVSRGSAIAV